MRPLLAATALLAALAIGCVDHRARPAVSPPLAPPMVSTATPGPIATLAPTPQEQCEGLGRTYQQENRTGHQLTLSPASPRGGEQVRVTAIGLLPGEYIAAFGRPQTDGWRHTAEPIGSVDSSGAFDATLVMPMVGVSACVMLTVGQPGSDGDLSGKPGTTMSSAPWFSTGGALSPAACDRLPEQLWLGNGGRLATISPPPYRVGTPIIVSGRLPASERRTGLVAALLTEYDALGTGRFVESIETVNSNLAAGGDFTFTFAPRADSRLSGLCVRVAVTPEPVGGVGHPSAVARFTYP